MLRWIVSGMMVILPMGGSAQAVLHTASAAIAVVPLQAGSRVNIDLRNEPLADAIQKIADRSAADIRFSPEALPKRNVSYKATNATLEEALRAVLQGTGMRAEQTRDGQFKIVKGETLQGTIIGKVVHAKTKEPLVGVRVTVGDREEGVVTGRDGTFRLSVGTGEQTLHLRGVGLSRQTRRVTVDDGQVLTIEVTMDPSANVLDEVTVTGTIVATERKAVPTPITVISAKDIEQRGITRIEQLLRGEVPGVYAMDIGSVAYTEGGSAASFNQGARSIVYSRGTASLEGTPNPVKTYVDGVEIVDPEYLGLIDPSSIERIEIITGPQAATVYGSDALGGVMQIFTKKGVAGRSAEFVLNLSYGMLESNFSKGRAPKHMHTAQVTGGAGAEWSYAGNVSYNYLGQWQPNLLARSYGASLGLTHMRGPLNVSGMITTRTNANGTMRPVAPSFPCGLYSGIRVGGCMASPYQYQSIETGDVAPTGMLGAAAAQRMATSSSQTFSLNADYNMRWGVRHHATLGRNYLQSKVDPDRPLFTAPRDTLWEVKNSTGQRTTANYTISVNPRWGPVSGPFTIGSNGSWGDQVNEWGCLPYETSSAWASCGFGTPSIQKTLTDRTWGYFASWRLGFFDRLYTTVGLRGEHSARYGRNVKTDWTPTNGITYVFSVGDLTVKMLGSYGVSTKQPTEEQRRDIWAIKPWAADPDYQLFRSQHENLDLRPERSRGPQGGMELYYGNLGSLTINHYQQTVDDILMKVALDSVPYHAVYGGDPQPWIDSYIDQWQNVASIRSTGWEGTASVNVWRFAVKGTYSWNDSRVRSVSAQGRDRGCLNCMYQGIQPGGSFQWTPSHIGNVNVSYAWGGTSINLNSSWRGAARESSNSALAVALSMYGRLNMYTIRRLSAGGGEWASPARTTSNLVMSQRLNPWASVTMNIQNLRNEIQSDAGAWFPTLGRQTAFGVSLRYPQR